MKTMLAYKKILCVCTAAAAIAVSVKVASATTIDFEDLAFGTVYNVGDSFATAGIQITGEEFFWLPSGSTTGGSVTVGNGGIAGGAGLELGLINNINLRFNFGATLDALVLQYGEFGGNINLDINGTLVNVQNFADIAPVVAGTSVFALDTGTPGQSTGSLFIIGNINSFAIGGQELAIDNVVASVPEPATITMLGFGVLLAIKRKKPFH
ncbi:MAG: PEP-CTERM sorting domain-containing protein [Planctomycetota bacterium]|jgi:hypothetical protein